MLTKLDVSMASRCQQAEMLKYAAEARRFEIERLWQRSLFFWGFIGAAFVAYFQALSPQNHDPLLPLLVSCFGIVSSLAWTLVNRGSKYWQEAWEDKVKSVELSVLGARLFSNIEPLRPDGWWGPARFSVSKLATALSDFTVLVWAVLAAYAFTNGAALPCNFTPYLLIGVTGVYIVCVIIGTRSGGDWN